MDTKAIIKAAKKSLKGEGEMKLKELAKVVVDKVGDDSISVKDAKKIIEESSKFSLNGKVVTLKRKQSNISSTTSEDSSPAKKSKTEASSSDVESWRKTNKIVLMHATDTDTGKKITAEISTDAAEAGSLPSLSKLKPAWTTTVSEASNVSVTRSYLCLSLSAIT